jgi:hypothetical protein
VFEVTTNIYVGNKTREKLAIVDALSLHGDNDVLARRTAVRHEQ